MKKASNENIVLWRGTCMFRNIQLNGERYELPDGQSVADLLQRLELTGRRLAVEVNREIVPRSQHAATTLVEGDQIEVVHAIGGG